MSDVEADAQRLLEQFDGRGRVAVAFSGGADSALVLAAAVRALGAADVLAVTAVSESLASGELERAADVAAGLRVAHLTPRTRELERAGYRANGPDRCYFCKSEVLDAIGAIAAGSGFPQVATGTNADDAADPFRPGIRAGSERGVLTPLLGAGLTKPQVRRLSRHWSLPTWDKPATPCLASRVAYGLRISGPRLARVDRAEAAVRAALGAAGVEGADLRVRDLGGGRARVEVPAGVLGEAAVLAGLGDVLASAGFDAAAVEVAAFRSGALNDPPAATPR
ncbi:ATP-dependent sacrificial sulfur transferase LarE [Actinacidiphila bryophytorum]|uniref:ATP-dependent sacrificial sulfur transferase LarE n=1 Tax=Actinacidiphila bryophytorum TaxID=1436133 RepID=UPI002176C2AA|nr:ExsB family transcriptional regulator [Actinacidiphila bryophytorum]UWE11267.1 ExsB family transcriptional regulator [Actinacidiphila bryophytorum]